MKKNIYLILLSIFFAFIIWLSITLSGEFNTSIQFPIKLTGLPQGYTVSSEILPEVKIRIRGKGWKLLGLTMFRDNIFYASVNGDSGRVNVKPINSVSENTWLSSGLEVLDISPAEIPCRIEKMFSTKVAVIPALDAQYREGFGQAAPIVMNPDSILVYGPYYKLKNMKGVYTERISYKSLDAPKQENLALVKIPGLDFEVERAVMSLDVQRVVANDVSGIPIIIQNLPKGARAFLEPAELSLNIKGGIKVLSRLRPSDFRAYAEYDSLMKDSTGTFIPKIITPPNIEILDRKPKKVKFIIQKY